MESIKTSHIQKEIIETWQTLENGDSRHSRAATRHTRDDPRTKVATLTPTTVPEEILQSQYPTVQQYTDSKINHINALCDGLADLHVSDGGEDTSGA